MQMPTSIYYPLRNQKKKHTLVLDLDETLIHTSDHAVPGYHARVEIQEKRKTRVFYLLKRPYLDLFLATMSQFYELVVFTASIKRYADAVIDIIDYNRVIERRYFRSTCTRSDGVFVKDLSKVCRSLKRCVIIDNSPAAYSLHPCNAVPIDTWIDDPHDTQLRDLIPFLTALHTLDDCRLLLSRRVKHAYLSRRQLHHSQFPLLHPFEDDDDG